MKECKEEFGFRDDEIKEGTDKGDESREKNEECKSQKMRADSALLTTKKQLRAKTTELIATHSTRTREKYAFDT